MFADTSGQGHPQTSRNLKREIDLDKRNQHQFVELLGKHCPVGAISKKNIYVLHYDDESGVYDPGMKVLRESLYTANKEDVNCVCLIRYRKSALDPLWVSQHSEILRQARGGGYWLWKPKIIVNTLSALENATYETGALSGSSQSPDKQMILIYVDDTLYFRHRLVARDDIFGSDVWGEQDENYPVLVWQNHHGLKAYQFPMRAWCKPDVLCRFFGESGYEEIIHSKNPLDSWAGMNIWKLGNPKAFEIAQSWLEKSQVLENICDEPASVRKNEFFKEHRHDQSLLGITLLEKGVSLQDQADDFWLGAQRYRAECRQQSTVWQQCECQLCEQQSTECQQCECQQCEQPINSGCALRHLLLILSISISSSVLLLLFLLKVGR